jgi:membrane associated rhomboid family serine protease
VDQAVAGALFPLVDVNDSISSQSHLPWAQPDAFPEKLPGQDYGYVLRGKAVGCSREQLIGRVTSGGIPIIDLAWHPDSQRVQPVSHIPFLLEALKTRARRRLRSRLLIGIFNFLFFGWLAYASRRGASHGAFAMWLMLAFLGGLLQIVQGYRGLRFFKSIQWNEWNVDQGAESYRVWVGSRPLQFTWLFLGMLGTLCLLELIEGIQGPIKAAGLDKAAVRHGEWWRLFTGPLLHGSILHFVFNATALVGLSRLIEVLTTRYHLAVTFAFSLITGSLFSMLWMPGKMSVGASGGLLGLIGFLFVLGYRRKRHLPPGFAINMAINIALVAVMGTFAYKIVDNAAHLGGLMGGLILGCALVPRNDPTLPLPASENLARAGKLATALLLGFAGFAACKIVLK